MSNDPTPFTTGVQVRRERTTCRCSPRLRTHSSEPEEDGGCQRDGGEECGWASVVAGRNPPPVLQPPEHDLDPVASSVTALVVAYRCISGLSAWNAGLDPLCFKSVQEPVCHSACKFGSDSQLMQFGGRNGDFLRGSLPCRAAFRSHPSFRLGWSLIIRSIWTAS